MDQETINTRVELLASALESGLYKQIHHNLRRDSGYCCLGVGCEIFRKETGIGTWSKDSEGVWAFEVSGYRNSGTLPFEVKDWFGFKDTNPGLKPIQVSRDQVSFVFKENPEGQETIDNAASYNDRMRKPFVEIAAAFREQYIVKNES